MSHCYIGVARSILKKVGKRIDKVPKRFQIRLGQELKGVAALIRRRRLSLKITQEDLAESLEISLDTIKAIESGRRHPSLSLLFIVCFALVIDISFNPASA